MAENTAALDRRALRCFRWTLAVAVLAVVLAAGLVVLMGNVDGQAKAIREDMDQGRLRQYGVVTQ